MVIGIYYGYGKPSDVKKILQPFVAEAMSVLQNGVSLDIKGRENLLVKIRSFICDSPARAFIKGKLAYYVAFDFLYIFWEKINTAPGRCIHSLQYFHENVYYVINLNFHGEKLSLFLGVVNFNSKQGCQKCTITGEYSYVSHCTYFPRRQCEKRTDEKFRSKHYVSHYKVDTPLTQLPIDMIEDFPVADSLHLIDLGIMKKCLVGNDIGSCHNKNEPHCIFTCRMERCSFFREINSLQHQENYLFCASKPTLFLKIFLGYTTLHSF